MGRGSHGDRSGKTAVEVRDKFAQNLWVLLTLSDLVAYYSLVGAQVDERARRVGKNIMDLSRRRGGSAKAGLKGGAPSDQPGSDAEGGPMTRKDAILNMHQVLIKRRDALRKALAGDLSLLKELRAQASGDVVDAALDSAQDEISSQLAEVESRELTRIETALERMRDGQYGVCEGCGTGIPMARLNALPYATLCIKCQRESEREGGGGRGDVDWGRLLEGGSGEADVSIGDIELDVS
jgi:DnaK suppressor protein